MGNHPIYLVQGILNIYYITQNDFSDTRQIFDSVVVVMARKSNAADGKSGN